MCWLLEKRKQQNSIIISSIWNGIKSNRNKLCAQLKQIWLNQSIKRPIERSIDLSIEQSINQSVNPSINPKSNQSINRSIDRYYVLSSFFLGGGACYVLFMRTFLIFFSRQLIIIVSHDESQQSGRVFHVIRVWIHEAQRHHPRQRQPTLCAGVFLGRFTARSEKGTVKKSPQKKFSDFRNRIICRPF